MGLDNGFLVKSDKRKLTRADLPAGIRYPFDEDWDDNGIEIIYKRKCWGLRNDIMNTFGWLTTSDEQQWQFQIDTPDQVLTLIELFARWLNEERWEDEGESIWDYENVHERLVMDIVNLALIYGWMENNPDVYLEFYDSY